MEFWKRFWVLVTHLLEITTLSSPGGPDHDQSPMGLAVPAGYPVGPAFAPPVTKDPDLVFKPPGRRHDKGDGSDFKCDYTAMAELGWAPCSTPEDRSCWLVNKKTGERYDINSDYENKYPTGVTREYWLEVTKSDITADGYTFTGATVFNESYPGPWIQACWGDRVVIHVHNKNPDRGTSIHWHGIRQLNTMHMDGVNGVTQCPIAPGSSFTYNWTAMQYGSSWYHSHYSEQYADGLVGPITLHGPSSGNFDEAADIPLLMTDWRHGSVFDNSDAGKKARKIGTILLNGTGDVTQFGNPPWKNTSEIPEPYTLLFDDEKPGQTPRPKRYLLRLINTSIGSTFIFSIDNHLLSIVSADFVPIYPYMNTSVLIGIGQRYNVIVEADPKASAAQPLDSNGNYWIRTWTADNCGPGVRNKSKTYMQTGILRYNNASTAKPQTSAWKDISLACSDEAYTSLRPVLPWTVGDPITNKGNPQQMSVVFGPSGGQSLPDFPQAFIAFRNVTGDVLQFTPLQINFSDPIFLNLDNTQPWNPLWQVYPEGRTNQTDWVWLAMTVDYGAGGTTEAHPIHLHGHDFAILQQAENTIYTPANVRVNRLNPPRRDVVLLPANGFIIIAFKADNPGSWLMHCHIAGHASGGLALQILERQADAASIWPKASPAAQTAATLCSSWDQWVAASYTPTATPLPDDSGI
ncbi:multicopper oxidase-domain-containing protein [Cercophora newfieldiana]|uniref:Multicopper oxidase-domain-containing protein n=1 Tax=Cercophora newfieldiana TaxID=92897 RepID=A0AA39YEF3_9PEZI|nr:multicopper oxidase-domain-containing protein [Cercophora newfieldiana]